MTKPIVAFIRQDPRRGAGGGGTDAVEPSCMSLTMENGRLRPFELMGRGRPISLMRSQPVLPRSIFHFQRHAMWQRQGGSHGFEDFGT